ncbi:MAG: DUF1257 domain-containing protein [Chloroflexi bacterium]|nr:DUF1257 domain-containing protein [Chloroflexota bacterium]MDA8186972.1 DUF1257 domain-containing protein [Dehalococcoidales bacterium]
MSAFKKFTDIQFRDLGLLKTALSDLGFGIVEEGDQLPLYGYRGDQRAERAELVIRRQHLTRASNDLGFQKTKDGYIPIVSDYDARVLLEGEFLARLRTAYNLRVVSRVTRQVHGTQTVQTEGNLIKVVVRY